MTARPHLILTLRRTGGTAFMSFLAGLSAFPTAQHEPFNADRTWGAVTRRWREGRDMAALEAGVAACLTPRVNVKHCVETVPPEVTRALIGAALARGYAIFLLTRRDEVRRLKSLVLAQATGVWGKEQAREVYPLIAAGEVAVAPVDLQQLRRAAAADQAALGRVLVMLRNRRVDFGWLLFEELYRAEDRIAEHVLPAVERIGVKIAADDPRLAVFAGAKGQDSGSVEHFLPNGADVDRVLAEVCVG